MKKRIVWELGKPSSYKSLVGRLKKAKYRVRNISPFLKKVSNEVDQLFLRKLRRVLATYPSPKYKLRPKFRSKKQHDLVMMLWRTRKIQLPYERTEELAEGWEVKADVKNDNIQITIRNSDEKSQYVIGKVGIVKKASDIKKLESPIQPFARANRWRPAHTVITPVMQRVEKYVGQRMEEWEDHLLDEGDFHE